jgi:choline dehydrogenase-like flavoprotein
MAGSDGQAVALFRWTTQMHPVWTMRNRLHVRRQIKHGCDLLAKAEATGKAEIRPHSLATEIRVDNRGKARSVVYFDENGIEHEQEARVIIVSAGSIQSPRLLLNSASSDFTNGLGNSSGLIGKNFMQHLGVASTAVFPERIDSYRGFFGGATSQDFARTQAGNSFARGWRNDLHSGIQGPVEMIRGKHFGVKS